MNGLLPAVGSMGCSRTPRGAGYCLHRHAWDEVCLVAGGTTSITHAGRPQRAPHGTLFLFRHGEEHGYRNGPDEAPFLWVCHYRPDPALAGACPVLDSPRAADRIWHLSPAEIEEWQALYLKLLGEQQRDDGAGKVAASAWLRLLLARTTRLGRPSVQPAPSGDDPALRELWELVQGHHSGPEALAGRLTREIPRYDALRHRFRRAWGITPGRMLQRLRLERAKHLLLETGQSIAEVATACGYARQHEFARAFRRGVGCTPSAWRRAGAG